MRNEDFDKLRSINTDEGLIIFVQTTKLDEYNDKSYVASRALALAKFGGGHKFICWLLTNSESNIDEAMRICDSEPVNDSTVTNVADAVRYLTEYKKVLVKNMEAAKSRLSNYIFKTEG